MKKIALSFLLVFFTINLWAATSIGVGSSSMDGGIRVADKRALNNALINAISSYYAESSDSGKNITIDHLKLIKKFRILERGVENGEVYYKVEAEFDEIGSVNFATKVNPNTVVYYIKTDTSLKEFKELFANDAKKILEGNNLSLKYQEDFIVNVDKSGNSEQAYAIFSITKSRYLMHTTLKIEKSKTSNLLVSETYFYTKKDTYPVIRAEATVSKMNAEGIGEAFNKVYQTTISYIISNFINNQITAEQHENRFDLVFINFKSFNQVMGVMDYLRSKGFFTTVKVKSVVTGKAEFEMVTKSNLEAIKKVAEERLKDQPHNLSIEDNALILEFQ
ncbi:hypothetical protein [Calditerrivibrio nitroreducens]|uniref:Flagellar assembly protein T N-terminal domain-containing protein n=1 Tax=Calditerrivibrio nitroreducens (strain DSM 19672 / NBRC 101217 / Yu37-1) TaxID=768670 RepID=E4TIE5_CALNY|nr:hypothetical protein [Calditerrivibrio nitroreducens]ADR17970.1 hypothetical protein Calni_0054 [Calditerrivibrio nitroreducens DSM 19672]